MELGGRVALLGALLCAGVALARPPASGSPRAPAPGTVLSPVQASSAQGAHAPRGPGQGAPARPPVTAVELQLPAGSDPAGLAELVAVRPGGPLAPREVRRTLERLWRTGRFTDVEVRELPDGEGVRLVFLLTPRPVVVGVEVEGNAVLEDAAVLAAAGLTGRARAEAADRLEEVERAVTAAYAARGYDGARVRAQAVPVQGGVEVVLQVEEGSATRVVGVSFNGNPGLPAAALTDALGLPVGAVLDRTRVEAGLERLRGLFRTQRFYTAQVDRPVERPAPGGVLLAVPVQAGPRFSLRFEGNRSVPEAHLLAALGYSGVEPLDVTLVRRLVRRLTDAYRYRGFLAAEVSARQELSADGTQAALVFTVHEDHPWVVRALHFDGRTSLPAEELRALVAEQLRARAPQTSGLRVRLADPLQLEGRAPGAPSRGAPLPQLDVVYVEEAYREAAGSMTALYREQGFLSAAVALEAVELDEARRTVEVRYRVAEGARARVTAVHYDGAPEGFRPERVSSVDQGAPFNPAAVERGRAALERALTREGYLFADVRAEPPRLDASGEQAEVRYRLQPGPRVRVGQVRLEGLERTERALVRANVSLKEGEVLDPEHLFESQRNLSLLGLFRQVTVRLESPEVVEPVKDVVVEVRERPRMEGNVAFGYFLAEGPRLLADADAPNLWGAGYALQLRGRLSYAGLSALPGAPLGVDGVGGRGNLAFLFPRFLVAPFQVGARVDAVGERTFRPSFDFTRYAGILGADVSTLDWLTLNLQGELEFDRVQPKQAASALLAFRGVADEQRQRYPLGTFVLASTRATATADFRDDPANTTRGVVLSGTAELTRSVGLDYDARVLAAERLKFIRSAKLSGSVTGYLPLGGRAVLAASVRGGSLLALGTAPNPGATSLTVPPRRFFLGGATSLRGFREEGLLSVEQREAVKRERSECRRLVSQAGCSPAAQLLEQGDALLSQGGDLFALGKLELRFPLLGALDLGLFAEAGNLWQRPERVWGGGALGMEALLRTVAGAGLRYVTPVGPLALDVGLNLDPDRDVNEQGVAVHFSIGLF